jgi:hypothetical protein
LEVNMDIRTNRDDAIRQIALAHNISPKLAEAMAQEIEAKTTGRSTFVWAVTLEDADWRELISMSAGGIGGLVLASEVVEPFLAARGVHPALTIAAEAAVVIVTAYGTAVLVRGVEGYVLSRWDIGRRAGCHGKDKKSVLDQAIEMAGTDQFSELAGAIKAELAAEAQSAIAPVAKQAESAASSAKGAVSSATKAAKKAEGYANAAAGSADQAAKDAQTAKSSAGTASQAATRAKANAQTAEEAREAIESAEKVAELQLPDKKAAQS